MRLPFLAGFLLAATFLFSQNTSNLQQPTSVNTDGTVPDASAILDVQATNKGILIPRMTRVQRNAIVSPATGLLVFNTDSDAFNCFNGSVWVDLSAQLSDGDGDTKIRVENTLDEDVIRFEAGGNENLQITPDSSVFNGTLRVVGRFVGGSMSNTASGSSSFVGGGSNNVVTTGSATSFIGGGFNNTITKGNSFIGAGTSNEMSGANSFIGGGDNNELSGFYSFIGGGVDNIGSGFASFIGGGSGLLARSNSEAVFGRYNTDYTPVGPILSNTADRLFVIGNGIDESNRSNAVTVLKNGNVGIDTDEPLTQLSLGSTLGNTKLALYETSSTNVYGIGIQAGLFRFHTSNSFQRFGFFDGASGSATEVFTIRTNGNVGIGINNPSQRLHVVGNICATGSIGACSDFRYKKDFRPINEALSKLTQLNGLYYFWKKEEFPEKDFTAGRQIGVIAQEVEALFPEMVLTDPDGYKSVDYGRLTPVLIEAVKELAAQAETQQSEIENLQSQLAEMDELKQRLSAVQAGMARLESTLLGSAGQAGEED